MPYTQLQDAAIPVHIVASGMVNGEEVLLSSGPVVDAVMASAAIPGALLDIALRDSDGIELARRVTADFKGKVRCTMVSMHMSSAYVLRPFEAGAQGYAVNDAGPAELLGSVHAVIAG